MVDYADRIAAEDEAAIEAYRAKFGDERAAQFAADLYKLRRTPPPSPESPIFGVFPRWTIVLVALWLALLETADKLPRLLLAFPGYEATLAEMQAKMMQPDITAAQLAKAQNEAKASAYQPNLAAVQLEKNHYEADATAYAPAKAFAEAKAARWQPSLLAAQGFDAQMKWLTAVPNDEWRKDGNVAISTERPNPSDYSSLRDSKPTMPSAADLSANSPIDTLKTNVMAGIVASLGASDPSKSAPDNQASSPEPVSAPPQPLKTPSGFHCDKAYMTTDFVICSSPKLMDAEARLEEAYAAARAYGGPSVGNEQTAWVKHFPGSCGLPYAGRPADPQIKSAAGCVADTMEARIKELRAR